MKSSQIVMVGLALMEKVEKGPEETSTAYCSRIRKMAARFIRRWGFKEGMNVIKEAVKIEGGLL
jgi:hypothetical protein